LLDEFRQRLAQQPVTYLEGRCLSYSQETPYRPILDILRHACGLNDLDHPQVIERQVHRYLQELGMAPQDSAPYLLHLLGVPAGTERLPLLTPEELKIRIYGTFRHLARQASQQQPLIIAIEDLHWMDATSEALLTSLVEYIAGVPILLLGTYRGGYRPPWLDKSYATQLALQPLTFREGQRLLQAVFATVEVPEALIPRLIEQAEGNPFFLEELAWTVLEHGASTLSVVVPDTVQAVLTARIDRLPPAEKHLLQVAAVIGKDAPLSLLAEVAELPLEAVHRGFAHLQSVEFLYESRLVPVPVYTFKHALTREVAYHSLLRSTRQLYHQRIAQALAEQFPETARLSPERLAHHYTEAGLGAAAIPYWQQAGQHAAARSANTEALLHLTQGLTLLGTLPDTPERDRQELVLQTALGPVLIATKGYAAAEVEETFSRAQVLCQRVGDTRQSVLVLRGLWSFYLLRAQYATAQQVGEQLLALAEREHNPEYLLEASLALGMIALFLGEFLFAHRHLERGIALYGRQQPVMPASHTAVPVDLTRSRSSQIVVACFAYAARTLWFLGYPDQAIQRSHEGVILAQQLSISLYVAQALGMRANLHQVRREIHLTLEWSEQTIAYATERGIPYWLAFATIVHGWALTAHGQQAAGIAQIRQGLATYQSTGARLGGAWCQLLLAEAYGKSGKIEEALQALEEALVLVDHTQERYYEAEIHRLKGEFLLMQGGTETVAHACFRQALAVARRQSARSWELRAATSLARLWSVQGKRAEAHALLTPIYGWFSEGFDTADLQEAQSVLESLSVPSA
jgi:predicted ATPase